MIMKFLYVGDPHNRLDDPVNRTDDFQETFKAKVEELKATARKEGVTAILQPGDFLDKPNYTNQFLMDVINLWSFVPNAYELMAQLQNKQGDTADIVKQLQNHIPYIGAIGNHELTGESLTNYPKTSLAFLEKMHFMRMASKEEPVFFTTEDGTTVAITATHYHGRIDTPAYVEDYIVTEKLADVHIHMVHGYLTNKNLGPLIKHTTVDAIAKQTKADLTIAGHDHIGFAPISVDGKLFVNPGSMTRTKSDVKEIRRRPKMMLIEVDKNGVHIEMKPFKSAPVGADVLSREKIEAKLMQASKMEEIKSIVNKAQVKQGQSITDIITAIGDADKLDDAVTDEVVARVGKKVEEIDGVANKGVAPYTITQVILENFQSHKHTVIDLHEGLNVFVGESSNGKSSIFRALRWVYDNHTTRGRTYIRTGAAFAKVTVVLSNGVRISRITSRKAHGRNGYDIYNPMTGETESGNTQMAEQVRKLLGFEKIVYDASAKSREELDINFMSQGEGWFFIGNHVKGSERSKIIGSIFGTHYTDAVMRELEDEMKKNKGEVRLREKDISETDERLKDYIYLRDMADRLQQAETLAKTIEEKKEKVRKLTALVEQKEKLEKELEQTNKILTTLADVGVWKIQLSQLKDVAQRHNTLARILDNQKRIIENGREARDIILTLQHIPEIAKRLAILKEQDKKRQDVSELLAKHTLLKEKQKHIFVQLKGQEHILTALSGLEDAKIKLASLHMMAKARQQIEKNVATQRRLEEQITQETTVIRDSFSTQEQLLRKYEDALKDAGSCPTCHSTIDAEAISRIIHTFSMEILSSVK